MTKQEVDYDPDFKIKGDRALVQARSTLWSIKKSYPKFNKMRWDFEEQKLYNLFVIHNKNLFLNSKKSKVFLQMAKNIITRDACQCKTHHAKMLKRNKFSLEMLIQNCLKELQNQKLQLKATKQDKQKFKIQESSTQLIVEVNPQNQQIRTAEADLHYLEKQCLKTKIDRDLFSVLNLESTIQQQNSVLNY